MATWDGVRESYEDSYPASYVWYADGWGRCGTWDAALSHFNFQIPAQIDNLTENYFQWDSVDENWWSNYLPSVIKQHAKAGTLTYKNFETWWNSQYATTLVDYLKYLQVKPVEFVRVLYWMSRNPDKVDFAMIKRLLSSMRLILQINGVPTRTRRPFFAKETIDSYINSLQENKRTMLYTGFLLFNQVLWKMKPEHYPVLMPSMQEMIRYMLGKNRHVYYGYAAQHRLIREALALGLQIPYTYTPTYFACYGNYL